MNSPAELFSLTLLATGGLYFSMFAYFNGLLGTKRTNMPILWNSEPLLWYMAFVLMVWVCLRLIVPDDSNAASVIFYLTGTGNLLIIYIYLISKIARHALPRLVFWGVFFTISVAVVWVAGNILLSMFGGTDSAFQYTDRLSNLLLMMTAILGLILFWCFLFAFWTAFLKHRRTDPQSEDRQTKQGSIMPGPNSPELSLAPGASVTFDFGTRHIEDHGYKADLRVTRENVDQALQVEVSNDSRRWLACEIDEHISTDYDVPYIGSPWRYVRVTNPGDQEIRIGEVYDLD